MDCHAWKWQFLKFDLNKTFIIKIYTHRNFGKIMKDIKKKIHIICYPKMTIVNFLIYSFLIFSYIQIVCSFAKCIAVIIFCIQFFSFYIVIPLVNCGLPEEAEVTFYYFIDHHSL